MYNSGKGVPQNDEEAVKWTRKAAEFADKKSKINLGLLLTHQWQAFCIRLSRRGVGDLSPQCH
jgi:TPR repeat protein